MNFSVLCISHVLPCLSLSVHNMLLLLVPVRVKVHCGCARRFRDFNFFRHANLSTAVLSSACHIGDLVTSRASYTSSRNTTQPQQY